MTWNTQDCRAATLSNDITKILESVLL